MKKLNLLYSGKAKNLYLTDQPDVLIQEFTDRASAFDGKKRQTISQKGILNNKISTILFEYLKSQGVDSHYISNYDDTQMVVKSVKIYTLEFVMRNFASGSIVKRFGIKEGERFIRPIFELYLKNDSLGDPMMNWDHAIILGLIKEDELLRIKDLTMKINSLLSDYFEKRGIKLVDFKLEFGKFHDDIILADELSPDTMRLWDMNTDKKLDKDLFRHGIGDLADGYGEILKRICN